MPYVKSRRLCRDQKACSKRYNMEECDLLCLETGATEDVIEVLKKFIEKVSEIQKICVGRVDCQWLCYGSGD